MNWSWWSFVVGILVTCVSLGGAVVGYFWLIGREARTHGVLKFPERRRVAR